MEEIKAFLEKEEKIKTWPSKVHRKQLILRYLIEKFEENRYYSEKEVNTIISEWHTFNDYFLLRRGLVEARLLKRTRDGSTYWREKMMSEEILNIFDENRKQIGTASREEVHRNGYWHETFQCWIVSKENDVDYIYLQLRSKVKKDFPNLLDITAAGHILANEKITDGIREVKEELGIDITYEQLVPLSSIKNCITTEQIIDKEWSHVYLYEMTDSTESFKLQKEEVSGMFKAKLKDFIDLCLDRRSTISVEGFIVDDSNVSHEMKKSISKNDLVPHHPSYFVELADALRKEYSCLLNNHHL